MNALVHGIEVNDRHGVGIYLQRLFPRNEDFVVFRSRELYGGGSDFGGREVFLGDRFDSMGALRERLAVEGDGVERILCVPYYPEDFRVAVLLKEVTGARLCTYLMDDQNVIAREVGNGVVRRLVEASDLCLGISREMGAGYGGKYGRKFWWLPPVVNASRRVDGSKVEGRRRCALVGNFWSARQLADFRAMVRGSGWTVDWFGRGPDATWLNCDAAELAADGIVVRGFLPDAELIERLRAFHFAVVPSGRMDADDDKLSFAAMSFPSRLVYLFTQVGLPVLLVGNGVSAAGRFIKATSTGLVVGYDQGEFTVAAERLVGAGDEYREAVRAAAEIFVLPEGGEWIWRSLAAGRAVDDRFERVPGFEVTAPVATMKRVVATRRRGWLEFDFSEWRYSRTVQLPWIRRRTAISATGPHSFAVGTYQRAMAAAMIRKLVPKGGSIRLLNGEMSDLRPLARDFELVQGEGVSVDALVSFDRETAGSRGRLEGLAKRGALQVHCWTAYLHSGHLEVARAGRDLLDEWEEGDAVVEKIMDDAEFLFMSPRAIEEFWPGVDSARIGRAFSLNVCWRGAK